MLRGGDKPYYQQLFTYFIINSYYVLELPFFIWFSVSVDKKLAKL